jgi:2,3-bisphosphoglycerate-dependent phosphoglycerate mutase
LVKHAQPLLDAAKPAREWDLAVEGLEQSKRLGASLRQFVPCRLVSSPEPKALRTCEIVSAELGVSMTVVDGLREIDRPVLPIMSASEHERVNARIFTEFDRRVMGRESAREARDRFAEAVRTEIGRTEEENLIVVAHGTVISLLVGEHNSVGSFQLWKRLQCPSFVVLEKLSLELVEVVDGVCPS